ncbi:MAG: MoxR family ATPase [Deltaproteobacteria bacterium]|nr:MoxR family ATPase [Deltaproteobacteria bacterium]
MSDELRENVPGDVETARSVTSLKAKVLQEVHKVIIGQDQTIDILLTALLARGHGLFVGVPGLAKTLLIQSLAEALSLDFNRIQFTPDLMPGDVTGTEVLEEDRATGMRQFRFIRGPVFTNILLADEINRTSPKTQAALLQAMQEQKVTASGKTYGLEPPFLVFATQNPLEQEGTYPLPEAQLDRFMFSVLVDYPSQDEELEIVRRTTGHVAQKIAEVVSREELLNIQDLVRRVPVADGVVEYAVQLARRTRPQDPSSPSFVREWVSWGAGPRASQFLILGAKARALLENRMAPSVEDIRALACPILRHRVIRNFRAEAEGISPDTVIERLLDEDRAARAA